MRLEQRFNGCSFCFFDRSSGLISSGIVGEVKRQCAAGGGGTAAAAAVGDGEDFIGSSSDIPVIGILFESPVRERTKSGEDFHRDSFYLFLRNRYYWIFSRNYSTMERICIS